jgi:HK97 family phage prohead protease
MISRTPLTAEASSVHKPFSTSPRGLWGTGEELPAYIQSVAHHLVTQGMDRSRAIGEAVGIVKNWAAGHDGHGHAVSGVVQAAAAKAIADWERLRAKAHATRSGPLDMSAAAEILRTFNAGAHPRVAKGNAGGGEFAPASSGSSSAKTTKGAKGAKGAKAHKDTRATPTNAHPVGDGETGQRVTDLQKRLNALGAHLAVDGKFGPKTLAAVRAFQKSHGLKVDGLVGPKTTAALRTKAPAKAKAATMHATPASAKRGATMHVAERADNKPYGDVKYADPKNGKYPIDTEDHARSAWSYINMPKNAAQYPMTGVTLKEVKDRIMAACKKFGIDVASDDSGSASRAMMRAELVRDVPLQDYHIVRTGEGDSSGRCVEAYMTVFDEPTEIRDGQGHYREDIDRAAFNKRIADLERSRNGFAAAKVFYNHGMTIHGSPSDRYSMPVAVCEEIRVDSRGPVTRSRYLDTPLGNEVLEMWRSGAITAQSFTGSIIRSSPELRRGDKYRPSNGQLPVVRRLELGLKEYGPTPFPAYQGAELVGVRMSPLGTWTEDDDEEEAERDDGGMFDVDPDDVALPPDEEAAAGGPPEVHPTRDHAHRLFALRTEQAFRDAGIGPLKGGW